MSQGHHFVHECGSSVSQEVTLLLSIHVMADRYTGVPVAFVSGVQIAGVAHRLTSGTVFCTFVRVLAGM